MPAILPQWIKPVEGFEARYLLDPDQFYPLLLAELAEQYEDCNPEEPDQYWLEICHHCAKLDAQAALKVAKVYRDDIATVFIIRGEEGYKQRWALKAHPVGNRKATILKLCGLDVAKSVEAMQQVIRQADRHMAREAREYYKRLRGFFPG